MGLAFLDFLAEVLRRSLGGRFFMASTAASYPGGLRSGLLSKISVQLISMGLRVWGFVCIMAMHCSHRMPSKGPFVQVRLSKELADRIDDFRHPTQSRTEWVNRVVARRLAVMESVESLGERSHKGEIIDG